MVDGTTRVCGLIGNPVSHSMSPLMQNLYAQESGVNLVYMPFKVQEEALNEAVLGAFALNILGLNVTVPHKQHVMEYCTKLDDAAMAIGAVNTLVREEHGYKGYNTDALGLLRMMQEEQIEVRDQACILIGAGGAAKAAAYVLCSQNARTVYVLNRNFEHAEKLSEDMNQLFHKKIMIPMELSHYQELPQDSYLAVQSTSVGMYPETEQAPLEDPDFYRMIHTGVDIIYTPMETRFMKLVRQAGGKAINGLDMLVYQGIAAYELWNPGIRVKEDTIQKARKRMIGQLFENLILIGYMGAGKTSVGRACAREYGMDFVDTDQLIEASAGMSISEIFETQGEEAFRRKETQILEKLIKECRHTVISAGGGLPLREENRMLLKKLGKVVYLKVSPDTVLMRLEGDTTRPLLTGSQIREKVQNMITQRNPVYEEAAQYIILADDKKVGEIVEELSDEVISR